MSDRDSLVNGARPSVDAQTSSKSPVSSPDLLDRLSLDRQQRILSQLARSIRSAVDLQTLLDVSVREIRQYLQADRVVIYQLRLPEPEIVAEAVKPPYRAALGARILDTCFQSPSTFETITRYRQGLIRDFPDIYQAQLSDCHIELLEQFQVKSCLVVPILLTREQAENELAELWGLVIVHQCDGPRQWQSSEMSLLEQAAVQMAIAIEQAELLQNLQQRIASQAEVEQKLREQTAAQKLLIQELAKTSDLLKQRNHELEDFAAIASHDLRAPLRGVANLATWIVEELEEILTPDTRQLFDLLQIRLRRMDRLIVDLLEYARSGQQQVQLVAVSVKELLTEIIDSFAVPDEFTLEIGSEMPELMTNRLALQQIFSNLIANAVKHHDRPNGRVQINARWQPDCYIFEIVDDGPGIEQDDLERIFKVFHTLTPASENSTNTGIGLAIVKRKVELQGGRVWVDSTVGAGSKFSFTWTHQPS